MALSACSFFYQLFYQRNRNVGNQANSLVLTVNVAKNCIRHSVAKLLFSLIFDTKHTLQTGQLFRFFFCVRTKMARKSLRLFIDQYKYAYWEKNLHSVALYSTTYV